MPKVNANRTHSIGFFIVYPPAEKQLQPEGRQTTAAWRYLQKSGYTWLSSILFIPGTGRKNHCKQMMPTSQMNLQNISFSPSVCAGLGEIHPEFGSKFQQVSLLLLILPTRGGDGAIRAGAVFLQVFTQNSQQPAFCARLNFMSTSRYTNKVHNRRLVKRR